MSQNPSISETIVALYLALKERDSCQICGGTGTNWVGIGDGTEVDAEPCECAIIAEYVLEKYRVKFANNVIIYLAERGIPNIPENVQFEVLMNELFKDVG